MRVVDPEDSHAVVNPDLHHPADLGVQAFRIIVEVERVDVLVLLRWVLRVRDRAVGAGGEPLWMRGYPGMVGCAAKGQVESDLQAEVSRPGHESVEVVEGS